jgi:hypothetical protein
LFSVIQSFCNIFGAAMPSGMVTGFVSLAGFQNQIIFKNLNPFSVKIIKQSRILSGSRGKGFHNSQTWRFRRSGTEPRLGLKCEWTEVKGGLWPSSKSLEKTVLSFRLHCGGGEGMCPRVASLKMRYKRI